jgi:hypothetical protein
MEKAPSSTRGADNERKNKNEKGKGQAGVDPGLP